MGRTLLDWLERSRCRKKRGWPTAAYAADTAALFLRALASHGTTTALVFGAHFADATAELFEAAAASGLRIASGPRAVGSAAAAGAACHARARVSRERDADRAVPQARPAAVCGDAALRATRRPKRCSRSASSSCRSIRTCCCRRTSTRARPRLASSTRLFPWAADYLAIYERYAAERRAFGDGAQRSRDAVGARAARRRRHGGRALSRQQRGARQRLFSAAAARRRGRHVRARHRRGRRTWDSAC